jgi:hypothetical protein
MSGGAAADGAAPILWTRLHHTCAGAKEARGQRTEMAAAGNSGDAVLKSIRAFMATLYSIPIDGCVREGS